MESLAESRKALYNTPRGASVLRSCGVDTYLRSPAEWRQAAASAAAARDQFAQLFGGGQHQRGDDGASAVEGSRSEATAHDGLAEGDGSRTKKTQANGSAAGRKRTASTAAVDAVPEPKKKRKKAEAEASAAAAPVGGQQTEAMLALLGTPDAGPLLYICMPYGNGKHQNSSLYVQGSGKLAAATRQSQTSEGRRKQRAQTSANPIGCM